MTEVNLENPDWWDRLTESQQQHINEGLSDVENGNVLTSEEFWSLLKAD